MALRTDLILERVLSEIERYEELNGKRPGSVVLGWDEYKELERVAKELPGYLTAKCKDVRNVNGVTVRISGEGNCLRAEP
jgi:hypothetical protein